MGTLQKHQLKLHLKYKGQEQAQYKTQQQSHKTCT